MIFHVPEVWIFTAFYGKIIGQVLDQYFKIYSRPVWSSRRVTIRFQYKCTKNSTRISMSPLPTQPKKLSLAVLISGTGRTLKNLLEHIASETLAAEIRMVIASTPHAKGLQYAEQASIPIQIVERQDFESREDFSRSIFHCCDEADIDYVILAGYIKLLEIPDNYKNRVLNIHPSLIPAFSGQGYYGDHVHEAVLRYGAKITGCTVHFVDNEYDRGPVILQRAIDVREDDDVTSLNDRVFELERLVYPEALQLLADGKIKVDGRIVQISK